MMACFVPLDLMQMQYIVAFIFSNVHLELACPTSETLDLLC
jgi:hypothetical protein